MPTKPKNRPPETSRDVVAKDLAFFDFGPDKDGQVEAPIIEAAADSDVVIRRGRIFRAGDYPDKDFSLSPKELKRIARGFGGPINIDSEHERSIFDGKLGKLMSVEASSDGSELHGMVAIPKWLDPILMEAGGKVSAAFDRITKKLVGLALTINPRVSDAALMAAFSVDQAVHGTVSVEELVGMAEKEDEEQVAEAVVAETSETEESDSGTEFKKSADPDPDDDDEDKNDSDDGDDDAAVTKKAKAARKKSKFVGYDGMLPKGGKTTKPATAQKEAATAHSGRSMMQTIHDVTASRGATCAGGTASPNSVVRYASKDELDSIQSIHDTCLQNGASCTHAQRDTSNSGPWSLEHPGVGSDERSRSVKLEASNFSEDAKGSSKAMKAFAKFMEELNDVDPRYGSQVRATANDGDADDTRRSLDEENARLREENRQMRMQGILDRAIQFADKMVNEGHAVPIEREGIITVHAQLEHDDTFSAKATFSNGMSRVAAYEASILSRPNNLLAAELLPASVQAGLIKFANMSETPKSVSGEYGKMSAERKAQLTGLDPVLKKAYQDTVNGRGN